MPADERPSGSGAEDQVFRALDPRLTIYALASGMDLARLPGARRLEWFNDGLERAILLEPADEGSIRVTASAHRTGEGRGRRAAVHEAVPAGKLAADPSGHLDPAVKVADDLTVDDRQTG